MPPHEAENDSCERIEEQKVPHEIIGGPLQHNHLITTRVGIREADPLLEQLQVVYKVSLLTPEMPLGTQGAVAPAEYRIEIMDPANRTEPASEEYVRFVYSILKNGMVPVERGVADDQPQSAQ